PPAFTISSTTAAAGPVATPSPSGPVPRSLTTTFAPALASAKAMPRPIPRPAPVTTAVFPSSSPMVTPVVVAGESRGGSSDQEAAVRREPLAGEEGAVVRREEERCLRHFVGIGVAAERRPRDDGLAHQVRHGLRHRRVNVAGTDRVHPDLPRADLPRHRAREAEDSRLGRAV